MTIASITKKKTAITGFSNETPVMAKYQFCYPLGNQREKVGHAAISVGPTRLNLVKGEVQVIGELSLIHISEPTRPY